MSRVKSRLWRVRPHRSVDWRLRQSSVAWFYFRFRLKRPISLRLDPPTIAELATGRYAEAVEVYEDVSERFSSSIPLRLLAAQAYRFSGNDLLATRLLDQIPQLINAAPWRFSDRNNLLAIGGFLLSRGEDPRVVLREFYDRALKADPSFVEAHTAIAELALDKADYQEAVKSLTAAIELRPEDPHLHVLLARAWVASDAQRTNQALQAALKIDPNHVDALLMQSQNLIDG